MRVIHERAKHRQAELDHDDVLLQRLGPPPRLDHRGALVAVIGFHHVTGDAGVWQAERGADPGQGPVLKRLVGLTAVRRRRGRDPFAREQDMRRAWLELDGGGVIVRAGCGFVSRA